MKTSQTGIKLIESFEGCRLTAYKDSVGVLTIGYGHTSGVKVGQTITQAQAEEYLKQDLSKAESNVNSFNSKYNFNQNQFDALVSFAFNIGSINQLTANGTRSISQISAKILEYDHDNGKEVEGLTKRRKAEKKLFDTGMSSSNEVHSSDSFVKQLQSLIGASVDGIAGKETLSKCPTLKQGSKGEIVKLLQQRLGDFYHIGVTCGYDGVFGQGTTNAVAEFQKQKGLSIDGVFGQNSWKAIS